MPENEDFDQFDYPEDDAPEVIEPDEDLTEDDEDDDDDADVRAAEALVAEARRKAGNRKQRRAAQRIPDSAPQPQDRKPKKSPARTEAEGTDLLLTLFGEELRVERSALVNSWDWQIGAIEKNPLQMVKGLLGQDQFIWFCMKSQTEGMQPLKAAADLMQLFAEAAGMEKSGNS